MLQSVGCPTGMDLKMGLETQEMEEKSSGDDKNETVSTNSSNDTAGCVPATSTNTLEVPAFKHSFINIFMKSVYHFPFCMMWLKNVYMYNCYNFLKIVHKDIIKVLK